MRRLFFSIFGELHAPPIGLEYELQRVESFTVDPFGCKYSWNDAEEDGGTKDGFGACGRGLSPQTECKPWSLQGKSKMWPIHQPQYRKVTPERHGTLWRRLASFTLVSVCATLILPARERFCLVRFQAQKQPPPLSWVARRWVFAACVQLVKSLVCLCETLRDETKCWYLTAGEWDGCCAIMNTPAVRRHLLPLTAPSSPSPVSCLQPNLVSGGCYLLFTAGGCLLRHHTRLLIEMNEFALLRVVLSVFTLSKHPYIGASAVGALQA